MPRPDLSERLGVGYRRIPVLAIGNDIYCDTSLIASVLERRFPASAGHPSLFPPRTGSSRADTGMIKAFAMSYADRVLFPLAAENLPYGKFPPAFIKDRTAVGREILQRRLGHWLNSFAILSGSVPPLIPKQWLNARPLSRAT